MNTASFTRTFAIAASLCVAFAATGCIADTEEEFEELDQNDDPIVGGTVFDVSPIAVLTGEEKAAPNTPENQALRARYKSVGVVNNKWSPKEYWGLGYCTATLVGSRTVLTAAHCFNAPGTSNVYFQIDGKDSIRASNVKIHPQYQEGKSANDMALLTLQNEVTDVIPKRINVAYVPDAAKMRLIGYGNYDYKKPDGSIGFKANGTKRIGYNVIDAVEPIFIRYLKTTGGGSYKGDSGGPLFIKDQAGSDVDLVAGVISGSTDVDGVTSNVRQFAEWIYDNAKGNIKFRDPVPEEAGNSHYRQIRAKSGKCLTMVTATKVLTLATCNAGASNQKWELEPLANGTYQIKMANQCLGGGVKDSCVSGGSPVNTPNNLRMGQCLADNLPQSCERYEVKSQDWILSKTGSDTFSIQSLNGLQCLKEGSGPILAACAGGTLQQWKLQ